MSEVRGIDIVNAKLERMLAIGGLERASYLEIANILKSEMQENFRVGGRPTPWPPSGRVRAFGGQTLRLSGRLMNSLTAFADDKGGGVSSNLVYARIHALGGVIRAKNAEYLRFRVPLAVQIASAKTGRRFSKVINERGEVLKSRQQWRGVRVKEVTMPQRDYRYISPQGASHIVSAAGRRLIVGATDG